MSGVGAVLEDKMLEEAGSVLNTLLVTRGAAFPLLLPRCYRLETFQYPLT